MKKSSHIFWACPSSDSFFRVKGEVRCRPSSVIPKLAERGLHVTVLIPYDPTLLPKSKLTPTRFVRQVIHLDQDYPVEIIKLTRAQVFPQIYMLKHAPLESAIRGAVFSKAALQLAKHINKPVDVFHVFGWQTALLPLFLEMEKGEKSSKALEKSKTFINVHNLRELGSFSPDVLKYLGIPNSLFHPDGIEFYGQVSFLKTGLLFSDGVGLVENGGKHRPFVEGSQVNGLGGLLNAMGPKLRRWASARSFKSHIDAYMELISEPSSAPFLPAFLKKLTSAQKKAEPFFLSWGPVPPERYNTDMLGFLIQSPQKGYCYWEWTHGGGNLGLLIDDTTTGRRTVLSNNVSHLGDFWLELQPDHYYAIELVNWGPEGQMRTLLRSRVSRTPRNRPSENRHAIFIDVQSRRTFTLNHSPSWHELQRWDGSSMGSSPLGGFSLAVPSSWKEKVLL